jgi:hypothetical protein
MAHWYLPNQGPKAKPIIDGLIWLAQQGGQGLIAVPEKSSLDQFAGGVFVKTFGAPGIKNLKKGGTVSIERVPIALLTERDGPRLWAGAVLVVFPTRDLLDKVGGFRANALVVPFDEEDVRYWVDTWSASRLGTSPLPDRGVVLAPVVEAALIDLTKEVNVSTGLSHPDDHSSAVELFEILRADGIDFSPEVVRAWLVSVGKWKPTHADAVESVCRGVLAGKNFQKITRGRWPGALARWKAFTK